MEVETISLCFTISSISISVIGCCILTYHNIIKVTCLRMAWLVSSRDEVLELKILFFFPYLFIIFFFIETVSLISGITTFLSAILNFYRVKHETRFKTTTFWFHHELFTLLYSTTIWSCLLLAGRKLYDGRKHWNTPLYKITIITIVLLNIIYLSSA